MYEIFNRKKTFNSVDLIVSWYKKTSAMQVDPIVKKFGIKGMKRARLKKEKMTLGKEDVLPVWYNKHIVKVEGEKNELSEK